MQQNFTRQPHTNQCHQSAFNISYQEQFRGCFSEQTRPNGKEKPIFFFFFIELKSAAELGIVGKVRNLKDGRVEAIVCGEDDEAMEKVILKIVCNVQVQIPPPPDGCLFTKRYRCCGRHWRREITVFRHFFEIQSGERQRSVGK